MSPTYVPSSVRDLRTHINTGIVLGDTGKGGVRRKIFEADKKTNNVSRSNAAAGLHLRTAR